jgi:hypothetical protein
LPTVPLAETCNAIIVGDQGASEFDCGCNQKPIRWIAMLEMMQLIAARGSPVAQRHRLYTGTIHKALDPGFNGNVEIDATGVDKQRNLPSCDSA